MKLYNQTKNQLRWQIASYSFVCSPYGDVDVPDALVQHCKSRGLPLSITPVAPEVKAGAVMKDAAESARNDEIFNLNKQLGEAISAEAIAKKSLEEAISEVASVKNKLSACELDLNNEKIRTAKLVEDYGALNKLFEEQSKELEIAKQERDFAKKVVEQTQSSKKEANPQKAK